MTTMEGVVGLDLSLSNSGMCYIPPNWNGRLDELAYKAFGTVKSVGTHGSEAALAVDESRRRLAIANKVVGFIRQAGVNHVAVEGYAFSRKNSASVTRLSELGGSVKDQVALGCRLPCIPVPSSSARKTVVGKLKRGKPKEQVEALLKIHGIHFPSDDIMDAFVVGYAHYCKINGVQSFYV
jgi:Holliday junction resolvasome RuvABC endonuclease subunit